MACNAFLVIESERPTNGFYQQAEIYENLILITVQVEFISSAEDVKC